MGMDTTCGSLALKGSLIKGNATVVQNLLNAGAIVIGKTNLSEWAYVKGNILCGWSAVGGQTQSPYIRGGVQPDDTWAGHSNPGGSSSGSATSVAAGFAPLSIGTETCGSLVNPGNRAALYTIKPTTLNGGIVSQQGIVPVSHNFDSAGPMTKCVHDLAACLDIIVDTSKAIDRPNGGYLSCIEDAGWAELKVGYVHPEMFLQPDHLVKWEPGTKEQTVSRAEVEACHESCKEADAYRR